MTEHQFKQLKAYLLDRFVPGDYSIHGDDHWTRVELNGLAIAKTNGANEQVVRLFSITHDCRREDDGYDREHGRRAADYLLTIRLEWLSFLTDEEFFLLEQACRFHVDGKVSSDPTIGACWDADRLDLPRCGYTLNPKYMSTEYAKQIAGEEMR